MAHLNRLEDVGLILNTQEGGVSSGKRKRGLSDASRPQKDSGDGDSGGAADAVETVGKRKRTQNKFYSGSFWLKH